MQQRHATNPIVVSSHFLATQRRSRHGEKRKTKRRQSAQYKGGKVIGHPGAFGAYFAYPRVPCTNAQEDWNMIESDKTFGVKVFQNRKDAKQELRAMKELQRKYQDRADFMNASKAPPDQKYQYMNALSSLFHPQFSYYFSAPHEFRVAPSARDEDDEKQGEKDQEDQEKGAQGGENSKVTGTDKEDVKREKFLCKQEKEALIENGKAENIPYVNESRVNKWYMLKYENAVTDCSSLQSVKGSRPLDLLKTWAKHLLDTLKVMHCCDMVHSDIKPANILVFRDDETRLIVKVNDLGIAASLAGEKDSTFLNSMYFVYPVLSHYVDTLLLVQRGKENPLTASELHGKVQEQILSLFRGREKEKVEHDKAKEMLEGFISLKNVVSKPFFDKYDHLLKVTKDSKLPQAEKLSKQEKKCADLLYIHLSGETYKMPQTKNDADLLIAAAANVFTRPQVEINLVLEHINKHIHKEKDHATIAINDQVAKQLLMYIRQRIDMYSLGISLLIMYEDMFKSQNVSSPSSLKQYFAFCQQHVYSLICSPWPSVVERFVSQPGFLNGSSDFLPLVHFAQPLPSAAADANISAKPARTKKSALPSVQVPDNNKNPSKSVAVAEKKVAQKSAKINANKTKSLAQKSTKANAAAINKTKKGSVKPTQKRYGHGGGKSVTSLYESEIAQMKDLQQNARTQQSEFIQQLAKELAQVTIPPLSENEQQYLQSTMAALTQTNRTKEQEIHEDTHDDVRVV